MERERKAQEEATEKFQTLIIDELLTLNEIIMKKKNKKKGGADGKKFARKDE